MSNVMDLVELCRDKKVYIQVHDFPDADAITSAFGLQKLLEKFKISACLCYKGQIDKLSAAKVLDAFHVEMYAYEQVCHEMTEADYIICVDSQKNAGNMRDFVGNEIACIDHHPIFVENDYLYEDIRMTGACATLIAEYYARLDCIPSCEVATSLLYGIKMDTLQFSRGVTLLDVEMYAFLLPFCDQETLAHLERNNMEINDLRAYGAAINSIYQYKEMGICFIPFSCPDGLIAAVSDFVLSLHEVFVSVVCSTRQDGIKISVRSELSQIHAGQLIHDALKGLGNGGGHASMAGGFIPRVKLKALEGTPEDRITALLLETMERMQSVTCSEK